MKAQLEEWQQSGYKFELDWLLRSVNTVLTGRGQIQLSARKEGRGNLGRPETGN